MVGEAKRRKAAEPNYGQTKRGLIVSPPIEIEGESILIKKSSLDPQELRFSLLFWDKLVWPASRFMYIESSPDEIFLETTGILTRPEFAIGLDVAQSVAAAQVQAFLDLDSKEPGVWSLAQGENSLLLKDAVLQAGNGISVELHRAIPVPDKDVPLNDILEFRRKRHPELTALRSELDSFVSAINLSSNIEGELAAQVAKVDLACADALRIGREWQFPVRLSNIKASLDLRPFTSVAAVVVGWQTGLMYGMPISSAAASAAISGVAASFKIGGDFGVQSLRPRQGPYRYVSQFHKEIF